MRIHFWGVRGSIPAPLSPDALEEKIVDLLVEANGSDISSPEAAREFLGQLPLVKRRTVGGNTPCVEVEADDEFLIIDAGSGIRELGGSMMARSVGPEINILLSHTHWDHIIGFPFFGPAFVPGNKINFWGCHSRLRERIEHLHHEYNFPVPMEAMPADLKFNALTPRKRSQIGVFDIEPCKLVHPGDSYAYSIEHGGSRLVYASDASYGDLPQEDLSSYHEFYRGADVLVFDSHFALMDSFEKSDWGHSSSFIGVDMAVIAGVKKLVLFHHDHLSSDERLGELFESTKKYLAHVAPDTDCEVILGYDGLELTI